MLSQSRFSTTKNQYRHQGVNDSDESRRLPRDVLDFQFALMRGQLVQQLLGKCCRDGKQCTER